MKCPKCNKISGDDWSQCGSYCPMGGPVKSLPDEELLIDQLNRMPPQVMDAISSFMESVIKLSPPREGDDIHPSITDYNLALKTLQDEESKEYGPLADLIRTMIETGFKEGYRLGQKHDECMREAAIGSTCGRCWEKIAGKDRPNVSLESEGIDIL